MEIKVSALTNEQLDEWVARAQGWELHVDDEPYPFDVPDSWIMSNDKKVFVKDYSPTSDTQAGKAQAFELMEKYWHEFVAYMESLHGCFWIHKHIGDDLPIHICRAVVASVYGDYVEVE